MGANVLIDCRSNVPGVWPTFVQAVAMGMGRSSGSQTQPDGQRRHRRSAKPNFAVSHSGPFKAAMLLDRAVTWQEWIPELRGNNSPAGSADVQVRVIRRTKAAIQNTSRMLKNTE